MKLNLKKILFKILLMILFVVLVQGSILISMSYDLTARLAFTHINESGLKNVESYSGTIGNWIKSKVNEITIYANTPIVSTMNWDITKLYLSNEIHTRLNTYDHFFVADIEGNYSTTLKTNAGNISDRSYFKPVMEGKTVVSEPVISRTTGNQISVIAVPIKNQKGEVIGLMGGALNLVKLYSIIENSKVSYDNSYSYIVDKNGTVITHPDKQRILKENITKESPFISSSLADASKVILTEDSGSVEYTNDGIKFVSYFTAIPNTDGWKLITRIPVDYMYEPLNSINKELIFICLLGAIVPILLAIFISESISKPIIELRNVFNKAAEGDLTVEANSSSRDEIGQAAQSFNKMMQNIRELTFYDALTNLPNKLMFMDRLNHEMADCIRSNEKLALLLFDIDKFENINNALGPSTGDELLKSLAIKIKEQLDENELVCRLGEDRFAVLLPNNPHETYAVRTSMKLLEIAKQPWCIDSYTFYITASIGISYFPSDAVNAEDLLKNALSAMLRAKKTGRNSYQLYDSDSSSKMLDLIELDNHMHSALDKEEFQLHYQPQVDIATGKIIGAEALIRWMHPELGIISPAKFIPLAEENGLIVPIGEWVLRTACAQNKKWMDMGYDPIYISVNISAAQMHQSNFVDSVASILKETQMDPHCLELEITESIAMEDTEARIKTLEALRNMNIRIAIDDFGTGYSSLSYLRRFQITCLKIDQSFIKELSLSDKSGAIVSTILDIGRNLNLKVTAEGVETEEQLNFLKEKNCDTMQGYFYSRPLPMEAFEELLKNPPVL